MNAIQVAEPKEAKKVLDFLRALGTEEQRIAYAEAHRRGLTAPAMHLDNQDKPEKGGFYASTKERALPGGRRPPFRGAWY